MKKRAIAFALVILFVFSFVEYSSLAEDNPADPPPEATQQPDTVPADSSGEPTPTPESTPEPTPVPEKPRPDPDISEEELRKKGYISTDAPVFDRQLFGVQSFGAQSFGVQSYGAQEGNYHTKEEMRAKWDALKPVHTGELYTKPPSTLYPYSLGTVNPAVMQDGLNMVNFMRWLAYLPDCVLNPLLNEEAQYGSILLGSQDQFSHYPPRPYDMSEADYNKGYSATSSSNLALIYKRSDAIAYSVNRYMDDDGDNNLPAVGHRRWILNPKLYSIGFGLAQSAAPGSSVTYNTMKVFDSSGNPGTVPYAAWPSPGAFPAEFMQAQNVIPWSVSLNTDIYDRTKTSGVRVTLIELTGSKRAWGFTSESTTIATPNYYNIETSGYGVSYCLIFRPGDIGKITQGMKFRVEITGLVKKTGEAATLGYTVEFYSRVPVPVSAVAISKTSLSLDMGRDYQLQASAQPVYADNIGAIVYSSSNPSVASVDSASGVVKGISYGTARITAASGGKSAYCDVTVMDTTKVSGITMQTSASMQTGQTLTLLPKITPTNATNKIIHWETSNPNIASVYNGVVYAVAPGSATISAFTEDGAYEAPCSVTVTAPIYVPVVTKLPSKTYAGSSYRVAPYVQNAFGATRFSSSNTAIATVDSAGIIKIVGSGKVTITAQISYYANASRTSVKVKTFKYSTSAIVGVTGVTLSKDSMTISAATSLGYTLSPWNATNKTITFTSSNKKVATVGKTGLVTPKGPGIAVITIKSADKGYTDTCSVTVPYVTGIKMNAPALRLPKGKTAQLTGTISPLNAFNKKVTWTSSNKRVATVSKTGLVIPKGPGVAVITVKTADRGYTATCAVTVPSVERVTLSRTALSLIKGQSFLLTCAVTPSDAFNTAVKWTTSNKSVATVSSGGNVIAKGAGSAVITVTSTDGKKTAACVVTVN